MTTISDMLAPRPASGTRSTDALSLSRAEGPSAFADVLDDVVEDGGRSRPETVTRREQERGPDKQDASVERSRAGQEDEETEATSSSREGDEDAAASDREDEEAYVPMGDASHVPQEPDSGEQVEGEIAPARQAPLWQRTGAQESGQTTRADRAAMAPAAAASTQTADGVQMASASGQAAGQQTDSALDLLTAQELMAPDQIQVETEGGELFERLQQALTTGSSVLADDVGEVVVPQVVRNMAALARNGVSEMRLQLQPGDLGEIELRVRAMEGAVRAEVMVQHPEVKALLETQMDRLRAALASQGLELEGFDVGVSDQQAQGRGDDDGDGLGGRTGREAVHGAAADEEDPAHATTPPTRPIRLDPNGNDWLV